MRRLAFGLWRRLTGAAGALIGLAAAPVLLGLVLLAFLGGVERRAVVARDPATTVILVTMDGIRLSEMLHGADPSLTDDRAGETPMPFLMDTLVPQGTFVGDREHGSRFTTGNPSAVSMPGYQSIFAGRFTWCLSNECREPRGGSLLRTVRRAHIGDVVFFAGWDRMCFGVPVQRGATVAACGRDAGFAHLVRQGLPAEPDGNADEMMFRASLARLRRDPPALLYLGLNDSDRIGHSGRYGDYLDTLRRYDGYLRAIWDEMQAMRQRGLRPVLIVTTDHGRGDGDDWTAHGFFHAGSRNGWMVAAGHGIAARGMLADTPHRTLFDLRPTIEALLGLDPYSSVWGGVMTELLEFPGR